MSRLPRVADRPHVRRPGRSRRNRARHNSVCTPRLLPSSSCHSSTTTQRNVSNSAAALGCERSRERLSGVVISVEGGVFNCRARALLPVSPVRRSTVQGRPRSSTTSRSARSVSAASARMGVSQRRRKGTTDDRRPPPAAPIVIRNSSFVSASRIGPHHAACVLPVPVAAWMRPLRPSRYACHTWRWNGNGDQPRPANHASAGARGSGCVFIGSIVAQQLRCGLCVESSTLCRCRSQIIGINGAKGIAKPDNCLYTVPCDSRDMESIGHLTATSPWPMQSPSDPSYRWAGGGEHETHRKLNVRRVASIGARKGRVRSSATGR